MSKLEKPNELNSFKSNMTKLFKNLKGTKILSTHSSSKNLITPLLVTQMKNQVKFNVAINFCALN